jgi:hypothetical protein
MIESEQTTATGVQMGKQATAQLNDVRRQLHLSTAELNYGLDRFGDKLAKDRGYKNLDGIEAIWLYLIQTYKWTPAYVKSMNPEDIRFVLSQEMEDFSFSR